MPLKILTLTKRADFLRLNRGKKTMAPYFILRSAPFPPGREDGHCRVGYTVTTKCGNAVVRNRIKRRLREAVRATFPEAAKPGMDYVLIARADAKPGAGEAEFADLKNAIVRALAHA